MLRQTHYSLLWDSYLQSVKSTSIDGNLETAREILISALADAEDYRELDERIEWCTYGIADECRARGDNKSAECLYKKLVEAKEKILGTNHPNVLAGLEHLAMLQIREQDRETKKQNKTALRTSNQHKNGAELFSESVGQLSPTKWSSFSNLVNLAVERLRSTPS